MRIFALVAGVCLLLLTVTVGAIWWVVRPMFYAGPVRGAAPVTSGELVELEQPGITRREIIDLLREREFETLTRIIETRNQRALADPKEEWELGRVFDAFDSRDNSLAGAFEEWIEASPQSFAPLLASGRQRLARAYVSRGGALAKDTTREQFEGMEREITSLYQDVAAALQLGVSSEMYVLLIHSAGTDGDQMECGRVAKVGLELMPASFRIRAALATCRLPRWGGGYGRVQQVAKAADAFVADNPDLAALHGIVEWDRGRVADGNEAIAHYTKALESGAYRPFYADRAAEYRRAKRYQEALVDIDAALALSPDSPDLLVMRMNTLATLGRDDEIPEIVELVEALDPQNPDLPSLKDYLSKVAAYEEGVEARTHFERGRRYLESGQHDEALAEFQAAIRINPAHYAAHANIDYIYAQRRDWPSVIAMWDAYLEKYPTDGKAVFERAGAIRHSGDEILAMQEANRACKMGVAPACAAVRTR
jgi:tetratricopeptide (TPR) repeat protein